MSDIDGFIPVPKSQLLAALEASAAPALRDQLAEVGRVLSAVFHYDRFDELERLKELYRPLDPAQPKGDAKPDPFLAELEGVLRSANFVEMPAAAIFDGARAGTLADLRVKTREEGVRRVRYFARGPRQEKVRVARLWGLRKSWLEAEILDDVVLTIELAEGDSASKALETIRRGARPGAMLLKHFGDVPKSDLITLHPGASPTMKRGDQLLLGVPAVAGGIPILTQLIPAIGVIFAVAAAALGFEGGHLTDDALKRALATLSLFVALATFVMRQRLKYDRQKLFYQKKLSETVYFHTVANNEGVLAGLVCASEEQDVKEAMLAYALLLERGAMDKASLDAAAERFLRDTFNVAVDFEIGDALRKLQELRLVESAEGGAFAAVGPAQALARLDEAWDGYFDFRRGPEAIRA